MQFKEWFLTESVGNVTMEDISQFLDQKNPHYLMDWLMDSGDSDFIQLGEFFGIVSQDDPYTFGDLYNRYGNKPYIKGPRSVNLIYELRNIIARKMHRMIERLPSSRKKPFGGDTEDSGDYDPLAFRFMDRDGSTYFRFEYPYVYIEDSTQERVIHWQEFLQEYPEADRVVAYIYVAGLFFDEVENHSYGQTGPRNQRVLLTNVSRLIAHVPYGHWDQTNQWFDELQTAFTTAIQGKVDKQQLIRQLDWLARTQGEQRGWANQQIIAFNQLINNLRSQITAL
jgi:hypothetical protein